jgi:ATP-binding cassette, subfamily B, bacterial PglK
MLNRNSFFYIIPVGNKSKIITLFCLSLVGVFLEIIGIGLILPVVSLISESGNIFFGGNIKSYYENSKLLKNFSFAQVVFIFLFLVFLVKFIFSLFLSWYQVTFVAKLASDISKNLVQKYIFADYSLYLKKDSAELIRNVTSEPNVYLKKIFLPIIQSIMDILILLGIIFLIFSVDFNSSFILISIYSIFGISYFFILKNKLYLLGLEKLEHDKLKIKSSQEAFFGIKTIKIFLKENKFIDKFVFHFQRTADLAKLQGFIISIPRFFIELLTISSFIILSLVLLDNNENFNDIVPTLALFTAAAFRIIPSVNRLMVNSQMLRSGISTFDNLYKELEDLEKIQTVNKKTENINFSNEISIKNVSFSYSPNSQNVLEDVNLKIKKGETIGIIGKTGSGKTTLIDLMLGLIHPTEGKILVDEKNISELNRSWIKIIGYVPQEIFLLDDTIKNNITLDIIQNVNQKNLEEAIKVSAVDHFLDKEPSDKLFNTVVGERGITLSGGQRQRIGIARAVYKKSEIIIFDESTNSLDSDTEKSVMESVYNLKGNKTLIIISHRNSTLNGCDKIYEIKNKKIFQVK